LNFLNRLQPLGLLILRLVLGIIMIAHGWQKIVDHLHGITGMMHQLGLPPFMAYLVVATEFGGGILILIGFLTRLAAFATFIDMLVAILKVHRQNGLFANWTGAQKGEGFEYHLLALAIIVAIIARGAGALSLDRVIYRLLG